MFDRVLLFDSNLKMECSLLFLVMVLYQTCVLSLCSSGEFVSEMSMQILHRVCLGSVNSTTNCVRWLVSGHLFNAIIDQWDLMALLQVCRISIIEMVSKLVWAPV